MDSSSSTCMADVRILSGRSKGSTDGVKRRRRGKTPAEKNNFAAKRAQEVARQRIEKQAGASSTPPYFRAIAKTPPVRGHRGRRLCQALP